MEARTTPEGVEGFGKLHFEVSPAPVTPSPANNAAMTMLRLWRPRVKGGSPVNDVEGPPAEGQHVHAMLVACLGSCVAGTTLGYASAAMPSIEKEPWYTLAKTAPGNHFPADIVLLAAAFGALCSGLLLHLVGHRRTFIVCVLGLLGAWIGIIFSNTVWMFMLNRAASGVWLGIMTNCASLYVTDVAPPEKRALYGSLTEAATSAGALIAYTVSGLSWGMQASTCAILCVAALSLQYYVVESPHWYLAYGCRKDVNVATARLYGVVPQPEYRSKEAEDAWQLVHPTSAHKEARMMCVCLLLHLAHNMSCAPLFTMRAIQVMVTLFGGGYGGVAAFLLLAAHVIVTANFSALTSLVGRRRLLCASALLVAGTLFALRPLDHLVVSQWSPEKQDGPVDWRAVLSVCVLVLGYSVGLCHLPTLLTGELIPLRLRFCGSSFVWASRWLIASLMVHFDAQVVAAFGREDTFVMYGTGLGLLVGSVVLLVPDTESRPLHDIDIAS